VSREKKRALIGILGALGVMLFVVAIFKGVASCRQRSEATHEPVETPEPLKAAG